MVEYCTVMKIGHYGHLTFDLNSARVAKGSRQPAPKPPPRWRMTAQGHVTLPHLSFDRAVLISLPHSSPPSSLRTAWMNSISETRLLGQRSPETCKAAPNPRPR